ncbi:hypothetical protein K466DRAFT_180808 [Polyporus arcularius HHB13444]|uniref:Uncharacterized protein n=1 Tax=Polyporus arcularius HHB13444 TaxID=1314778 RepID=A0A5C3P9T8_9APHY|nr:hypothetical protein K466DRAFT_180808 [Polyporus arcularius HHB13444]
MAPASLDPIAAFRCRPLSRSHKYCFHHPRPDAVERHDRRGVSLLRLGSGCRCIFLTVRSCTAFSALSAHALCGRKLDARSRDASRACQSHNLSGHVCPF